MITCLRYFLATLHISRHDFNFEVLECNPLSWALAICCLCGNLVDEYITQGSLEKGQNHYWLTTLCSCFSFNSFLPSTLCRHPISHDSSLLPFFITILNSLILLLLSLYSTKNLWCFILVLPSLLSSHPSMCPQWDFVRQTHLTAITQAYPKNNPMI